ncbi:MAG: HU family DNA-binding protein [Nocardioides sp.]|nr:HU family DNA-binding protein [Nocardioides sp.]
MVTQREHIDTVAARTGKPVTEVAEIVRAHLGVLSETVAAGEKVTLTGFGTFARNLKATGPATPSFKPGTALRRAVEESAAAAPAKKTVGKKTAAKSGRKKTTPAKKTTAEKPVAATSTSASAAKKSSAKQRTAKTTRKAPAKKAST